MEARKHDCLTHTTAYIPMHLIPDYGCDVELSLANMEEGVDY
jgi:hypothetical protein